MRPLALSAVLALALGCQPPPPPAPAPLGPSSSPTRWVHPAPPRDATLLVLPARTVGDPSARGAVSPLLHGRVEALHVRPGDRVAVDAPVAEMASPDALQAAAALRAARHQLKPVTQRLQELRRLRKQGLAASDTVYALVAQQAALEAEAETAKATLRAAGLADAAPDAALRNGRLVLRSPVAGVVRAVHARLGEVRGPDDGPLVEILGVGPARIEARLPRQVPAGATPVFAPLDGEPVPLAVEPVAQAPALDDSGQIAWFAPADPALTLPHGLRGELRLVPASADIVELPRAAVVMDGGQATVARRGADGAVAWVPVEVVSGAGATALVRGPLRAEDEVAADGRKVRAALHLAAADGGAP